MTLKVTLGTSLAVQCLTPLPMQGTCVQSLVREDPTCCGAIKLLRPMLLSPELQILSPHAATTATTTKPAHLEAMLRRGKPPPREAQVRQQQPALTAGEGCEQQPRPSVAKNQQEGINIITFQMFKKLSIAIWKNMRRNNGPKLSKHSKKHFKNPTILKLNPKYKVYKKENYNKSHQSQIVKISNTDKILKKKNVSEEQR